MRKVHANRLCVLLRNTNVRIYQLPAIAKQEIIESEFLAAMATDKGHPAPNVQPSTSGIASQSKRPSNETESTINNAGGDGSKVHVTPNDDGTSGQMTNDCVDMMPAHGRDATAAVDSSELQMENIHAFMRHRQRQTNRQRPPILAGAIMQLTEQLDLVRIPIDRTDTVDGDEAPTIAHDVSAACKRETCKRYAKNPKTN